MKILILNQAFYPDVVSTAQHAGDLAQGLVSAGHEVTVIASRRGYDDPKKRFAPRETWRDIRIIRVGATGLGKSAKWRRAADFATFMAHCALRALIVPRVDVVIAMTSPPLISVLAALLVPLKARHFVYWCMDLNPDEAIVAGWLREDSVHARLLSWLLRYSLRKASAIIALDRFMKQRIEQKRIPGGKVIVISPWSHDDQVGFDPAGRAEFRSKHGLDGRFVVMYSGNHSPCHPLDTLIEAARRLSGQPDIVFCFIGGGSEFRRLEHYAEETGATNLRFLPYQPLAALADSLSAADLHVVVMGNAFVGIVHPCKIYNVLAVGAPFLYVGPEASHVVDVVTDETNARPVAFMARHDDVERVIQHILTARRTAAGSRIGSVGEFSKRVLLPRVIGVVENVQGMPGAAGEAQVSTSRSMHA